MIRVEKPSILPITAEQVEIETGQRLGVAVIDCRKKTDDSSGNYINKGPTLVVGLGFNSSVEEFTIQQHAVMAQEMGARFIVVDTPGVGELSSPLQDGQARDLLLGKYDSSARAMLLAAIKAGVLTEGEEIGLLGYSMGASTIAAMAKLLNEDHDTFNKLLLTGAYMIEPVADHKQPPWTPAMKMGTENKLNDRYLAENMGLLGLDGQPWPVGTIDRRLKLPGNEAELAKYKEWTKRQARALLLGGWALGRDRIPDDLQAALDGSRDTTRFNEASVISVLAPASGLSDSSRHYEKVTDPTRRLMSEMGSAALLTLPDNDGHAFMLSL